jgi:hypothetical protein
VACRTLFRRRAAACRRRRDCSRRSATADAGSTHPAHAAEKEATRSPRLKGGDAGCFGVWSSWRQARQKAQANVRRWALTCLPCMRLVRRRHQHHHLQHHHHHTLPSAAHPTPRHTPSFANLTSRCIPARCGLCCVQWAQAEVHMWQAHAPVVKHRSSPTWDLNVRAECRARGRCFWTARTAPPSQYTRDTHTRIALAVDHPPHIRTPTCPPLMVWWTSDGHGIDERCGGCWVYEPRPELDRRCRTLHEPRSTSSASLPFAFPSELERQWPRESGAVTSLHTGPDR